jgi:hypothetical protein
MIYGSMIVRAGLWSKTLFPDEGCNTIEIYYSSFPNVSDESRDSPQTLSFSVLPRA